MAYIRRQTHKFVAGLSVNSRPDSLNMAVPNKNPTDLMISQPTHFLETTTSNRGLKFSTCILWSFVSFDALARKIQLNSSKSKFKTTEHQKVTVKLQEKGTFLSMTQFSLLLKNRLLSHNNLHQNQSTFQYSSSPSSKEIKIPNHLHGFLTSALDKSE